MKAAILLGCLDGLLVALLGVGVVLVYKADRFVNLANAQLGLLSTLVMAKLALDAGLSWYLAFATAVALGVLVGAACRLVIISRLEHASRTSTMIATLGLSQMLLAVAYFEWLGPDRVRLQEEGYPLPFDVFWEFDGLAVTGRHVLVAIIAPTVLVALTLWLRSSSFGRSMRAAASNPDAARLAGIDIRRTSAVAWAITGGLSAVGAVLAAPGQAVLEVQAMSPLLLLLGLGAAALAGFTSLPGAIVAGVGLGVVDGVAVHLARNVGAGVAAVFASVLLGLLVRSAFVGAAEADDVEIERSEEPLRIPDAIADRWFVRRRTLVAAGVATSIGVVLPFLPWMREPHNTFVLAHVAVFALAALSVTMLSGWGGQVSLGQFAFVAIGAFTAARLAPRGWSLLATMVIAAIVGAGFAVVAGLPAARSRGLTLAVTSLGVAVVGPAWLFHQSWLAPPGTSSVDPAYQAGLGRLATQKGVYFAGLAILVLVGFALVRLRRSNIGRAIVAVRDNATTASTFGFSPALVRLTTFAMSGALAAVAGVLWLAVNRNVSLRVAGSNESMLVLAAAVIGGVSSVAGAVLGSIALFGLPLLLADVFRGIIPNTFQLQLFLSGVGLLQTQIVNPGGITSVIRRRWQGRFDRMAVRAAARPGAAIDRASETLVTTTRVATNRDETTGVASVREPGAALSVHDVSVSFGGVRAVDAVALEVAGGEIVGVIGANGAGKTTLLNAIGGLVPSSGSVRLYGREVSALAPARRARLGVSRGFQDARLFPALTVRETVELALHRRHPTGALGALVAAPWVRLTERRLACEADDIIDRFGLEAVADLPGDRLSTGTRHIADLAAQAATRPRLMVLDEPTSGIAQRETEAFRPLLRAVADEVGCAVLVVEHDMPFLMAVADRIYCLERGRVIAEGTPDEVREDPAVVASYLGSARPRPAATATGPSRGGDR